MKKIISMLEYNEKNKLLDIGIGTGFNSKKYRELGFNVEICDHDKNILKALPEFKSKLVNICYEKLPYKNSSFDVIIMSEVIEHLENTWFVIKEINRILKKGGIFIITTPYIDSIIQKIYFFFTGQFLKFQDYTNKGEHITPIHLKVLKNILYNNKFIIGEISFECGWIPILRIETKPNKLIGNTLIIKSIK